MQKLKSHNVAGKYIHVGENNLNSIIATWEKPNLLVLDFWTSDVSEMDNQDPERNLLGSLRIPVKVK